MVFSSKGGVDEVACDADVIGLGGVLCRASQLSDGIDGVGSLHPKPVYLGMSCHVVNAVALELHIYISGKDGILPF